MCSVQHTLLGSPILSETAIETLKVSSWGSSIDQEEFD